MATDIFPSTSPSKTSEDMFESISSHENVFYKLQQRGEEDLDKSQKIAILSDLFQKKPNVFLERYHQYIEPRFVTLFDENDPCGTFYLDQIKSHAKMASKKPSLLVRNRRFLAMQELRNGGSYFSNEKMREREPYLFDVMVGQYLDDEEKFHLRPTIEINDANMSEFSKLLEQFDDTQRVSDRRHRYLENFQKVLTSSDDTDRFISHVDHRTVEADEEEKEIEAEFQMEFDSSDEEGRELERNRIRALTGSKPKAKHCARDDDTFIMRRHRDRKASELLKSEDEQASEALSTLQVSKSKIGGETGEDDGGEWSSGDEDEARPTGLLRDQLRDEFVTIMEERFLEGKDAEFFDYSQVDAGMGAYGDKVDRIRDQDMEDAYFDSEEVM